MKAPVETLTGGGSGVAPDQDDGWIAAPARVAVFRALQLGDLLCAVPALRVLRRGLPQAHITLIGLPWAQTFAERFSHYVDDFLAFPGAPGFPEQAPDLKRLPAFLAEARRRQFDWALQLHGSGELSNMVVAGLGARCVAGFVREDTPSFESLRVAPALATLFAGAARPQAERFIPWPQGDHELRRYLRLTDHLGLPAGESSLELPLTAADRQQADVLSRRWQLRPGRYICVHPGARLPSRRWPAARFAEVVQALVEQGWPVVVTGSADEAALAAEICGEPAMVGAGGRRLARQRRGDPPGGRSRAVNLAGATSLGSLAALLADARLVICNDTGVSHVAVAMGTPSVVIASGSEVERWAPEDWERHRVLSTEMPCRPCMHVVCPIGHPCALGVSVETVLAEAARHLQGPVGLRDAA